MQAEQDIVRPGREFPPFSKLWLDTETYCETPIRDGTHRYAERAEILLVPFALDDGPVEVIDLTAPAFVEDSDLSGTEYDPQLSFLNLLQAARDSRAEVWAHKSDFDRTVVRHTQGEEVCPPLEQWRDTMVQALAHSLPAGLGPLCSALRIPSDKAKDKRGRDLIKLFCKPLGKNRKLRRATRCTHPAQWEEFKDYARQDIAAMRECHRLMPKVNYPENAGELALWHLDQRINDRGVAVDLRLSRAAVAAIAVATERLADDAYRMTDGAVEAATQRDAMLAHLFEAWGFHLDDLKGSTVERAIEDPDTPEPVRELLRVRLQASTTSTAKYGALLRAVSDDGRLRGLLQFLGAARTGRWAGRIFQPQNLPRPVLSQDEIDEGIEWLYEGVAELLAADVMALASSVIRGALVAAPGCKFCVADLSNIEGRMLAWLAGEEWKLKAFRDFDAGTGYDLYALAYAKSFGVSPEAVIANKKTGDGSMRQIGKVQELALGYQGGVGAFVTFAAAYRIDLDQIAASVLASAPPELVEEARSFYERLQKQPKPQTFGLAPDTFIACDVIKRGWRNAHAATVAWWTQLQEAFFLAANHPGETYHAGRVSFKRSGNWLRVRLPSGRMLCYPSPRAEFKGNKAVLSYVGLDQYSRKWKRLYTYGGKIAENITQAAARDVLAANMPAIEADGYPIVLSVHDELITEPPAKPDYTVDRLIARMATRPPWAPDLPLAAAGFETDRYKKD